MACLLKAPGDSGKGVVTFTTPERDAAIAADEGLRAAIERLKSEWVIGLHHNWHDHDFKYDPLFDFSMAGEGDLIESSGREFTRIDLDACNFVPDCFRPGTGEKFWDVLHLGKPVFFKGTLEFLDAMRVLYDEGNMLRVLWVSAMPPFNAEDTETVTYDLTERYEAMFSPEEQALFTLLTPTHRFPFPLDLPTLAHLYRSSKVFVHFSDNERRCRIAAYAWASGLPVVAFDSVGSLLPPDLRREPAFFEMRDYGEFPDTVMGALAAADVDDSRTEAARAFFDPAASVDRLRSSLQREFPDTGFDDASRDVALEGLDIRLGRHHEPIGAGTMNAVPMSLERFVTSLGSDRAGVREAVAHSDPERWLAGDRGPDQPDGPTSARRGLMRVQRRAQVRSRRARQSAGAVKRRLRRRRATGES